MNNLQGFWDDNLDTPTVYLDDTSGVYDARDAWAQGTGVMPVDTSILDANDAIAQGYGTVPDIVTSTSGSGWSLHDLLSTGTSLIHDVMQYRASTLPTGQRIYTRFDPATGQYVTGGRTVTLPGSGAMNFIQQNAPLLIGGALLLVLAMNRQGSK
ncbi:MAG TPA: hypothetical protein VJ577_11370 [Burkholderiaceae bacterium]|nr:hypothetical protein [Burkholderiaceae bacterium]